jgi:hypothetical protein
MPKAKPKFVRTITLKSGTRITLEVSGDPLALQVDERNFVFELIDTIGSTPLKEGARPKAEPNGSGAGSES